MTARMFAIVPAMVLALGTAAAQAQPAANPRLQFNQASMIDHGTPLRPFDHVSAKVTNAAYVSDWSDPSYQQVQKGLMNEPGYSIGTGTAELRHSTATIGDGSQSSDLLDPGKVLHEPLYDFYG